MGAPTLGSRGAPRFSFTDRSWIRLYVGALGCIVISALLYVMPVVGHVDLWTRTTASRGYGSAILTSISMQSRAGMLRSSAPSGSQLAHTEASAPTTVLAAEDTSPFIGLTTVVLIWIALGLYFLRIKDEATRGPALAPAPTVSFSSSTPFAVGTVRVRLGRLDDVPTVARLMQGALFRIPGVVSDVKPGDVPSGLVGLYNTKLRAMRESRELNVQVAARRRAIRDGQKPTFEEIVQLNENRKRIATLRFARFSALLVAEATSRDNPNAPPRIIGCATVFLNRLNASLPSPDPPVAPFHFYVSNVAVNPAARRQGVARHILKACERLCQRWGHPYVTLHVEPQNRAAFSLYRSAGYEEVEEEGDKSQVLLVKRMAPDIQEEQLDWGALSGRLGATAPNILLLQALTPPAVGGSSNDTEPLPASFNSPSLTPESIQETPVLAQAPISPSAPKRLIRKYSLVRNGRKTSALKSRRRLRLNVARRRQQRQPTAPTV